MYFNLLIVKGVPPTQFSVPCMLFWNLSDDGKKTAGMCSQWQQDTQVLRAVLALKVNTDNE
jgi:hypothetical protein